MAAAILAFSFVAHAQEARQTRDETTQTAQRIKTKAEAIVAGVQKELDAGKVRQDVIDKMQKLQPLMEAGKLKEAEALVDEGFKDLGIKFVPPADGGKRQKDSGQLPEIDLSGFAPIFDGKTLDHWDGDPTYWRVEEGKLVGTVTPETLLKKNSWIVYRGELVEDFELVLDYRVSAGGNSGVGYRLAVLEGDPVSVRGPQADIHGADMFTGICYEENGRKLLAARGQSTWLDPNALPRLVAQLADPEALQSVVRKEDWNRYRLVVRGHDAQHFLNGVLMSEVHDHDEPNRMKQGLLGVQVHVGPPMKVEYKSIYLKHLGPKPKGSAARGAVTYKSGSLREPEHSQTFDHLAKQAARVTRPPADEPLEGKEILTFKTRQIGIVRSDLADVKLYGGAKPLPEGEAKYDLVVMQGDQTVRVPAAGRQYIGKPLDREFQVELEWDKSVKRYVLKTLQQAK
jgi:hypothetical protein